MCAVAIKDGKSSLCFGLVLNSVTHQAKQFTTNANRQDKRQRGKSGVARHGFRASQVRSGLHANVQPFFGPAPYIYFPAGSLPAIHCCTGGSRCARRTAPNPSLSSLRVDWESAFVHRVGNYGQVAIGHPYPMRTRRGIV